MFPSLSEDKAYQGESIILCLLQLGIPDVVVKTAFSLQLLKLHFIRFPFLSFKHFIIYSSQIYVKYPISKLSEYFNPIPVYLAGISVTGSFSYWGKNDNILDFLASIDPNNLPWETIKIIP